MMETKTHFCLKTTQRGCSAVFAFFLIVVGTLLLGTRLGFIPNAYVNILLSWQMLLILFGCLSLVKKHLMRSLLFLSLGVFFIIPEIGKIPHNFIGEVPENFIHLYWPVLLILFGVFGFIRFVFFPKKSKFYEHRYFSAKNTGGCCNGRVEQNNVFQKGENIVLDPIFKGGEVNAIFSESVLDLRKTQIADGETRLEINVVFGAVQIFVPKEWNVQLNVESVFGAFEDKRPVQDIADKDPNKTLLIFGSCVFGAGELKN